MTAGRRSEARRQIEAVAAGKRPGAILCGDAMEVRDLLPADGIAIVTDPPYGIAYIHGGGGGRGPRVGQRIMRHAARIAGDEEKFDPAPWLAWPCLLFGADHYADALPTAGTWLGWDKAPAGGPADSFVDMEFAWCSRRGVKRNVCRWQWKGVACRKLGEDNGRRLVPCQKPLHLMAWAIRTLDPLAQAVIVDPFCGSGTTCLAAHRLGYRWIGVEIDPAKATIAADRLAMPAGPREEEDHADTDATQTA